VQLQYAVPEREMSERERRRQEDKKKKTFVAIAIIRIATARRIQNHSKPFAAKRE